MLTAGLPGLQYADMPEMLQRQVIIFTVSDIGNAAMYYTHNAALAPRLQSCCIGNSTVQSLSSLPL